MTSEQQTASDPLAELRAALAIFADLLGNVSPEQMTLPTPSDEWDVRALVNHVVLGNTWAAANVRTGNAPRPSGDAIGDRSPMDAFTASADDLLAAFTEPGALERTVTMPFGEMPAARLATLRWIDVISHAWDLAKATGQDTDLAPEMCATALVISQQMLDGRDRTGLPFKDEVLVSEAAHVADRLAGFLGKQV